MTVIDQVRQPEYVGENRCVPCTAVNAVIAVGLAGVVGVAALQVATTPLAVGSGAAVLVLSALAIWLRGYLVPGTPELTKRYLPDWLLAKFDKAPEPVDRIDTEGGEAIEPERVLVDAGVIEPCADVDDLCLSEAFGAQWEAELERVSPEGAEKEALAEVLDADGEVEFEEYGSAFAATVDGEYVGQWESRAALVADLAAARVLPDHVPDWERYDAPGQGTLVRSLRVFVETCPSCGGPVVPSQETVSSCCREYDVMAIACSDCGERLLETPAA